MILIDQCYDDCGGHHWLLETESVYQKMWSVTNSPSNKKQQVNKTLMSDVEEETTV